jgi:endoglucanase
LLAVSALAGAGSSQSAALSIRVSGNHFVNGSGHTIRLLGVNRSSFEYACAQGWGLNEGPTDAAAIAAMKSWRINVVRVPLNEACWLGLSSVKPQYRGATYRRAVVAFVQRLHAAGLYVILDLHWNAPGKARALGQQLMPDADHTPAFWRSVATTLKADHAVLFDLYNEPHDVSWSCWRSGCGAWAGMQRLVTTIRATGATQPILVGGLGWAGMLDGWLRMQPRDPRHALVASVHKYNFGGGCVTQACWNAQIAPVAARVPVVTGELGEDDCAHGFIDEYMGWADAHGVSYLGWAWNVWDCKTGPALITDYAGTPTPYGVGLRDHLAA